MINYIEYRDLPIDVQIKLDALSKEERSSFMRIDNMTFRWYFTFEGYNLEIEVE